MTLVEEGRTLKEAVVWENYPPYQWFIKKAGGPDRLVTKNDGLSWMLRIRYRELAHAFGINPKMDRKTASLVKSVDEFYGFKESNARNYERGTTPTEDANPAEQFFKTTSLANDPSGKFSELSRQSNREAMISQIKEEVQEESGVSLDALPSWRRSIIEGSLGLILKTNYHSLIRQLIAAEIQVKFLNKDPQEVFQVTV